MKTRNTFSSFGDLSLTQLKRLVYNLASKAIGAAIATTKILKKYAPSKDLRCRANWIDLAIRYQNRFTSEEAIASAA